MYGIELYVGHTQKTLNKVSVLLMKCNKAIYAKDYHRVSNSKICRDIKVDPPEVIIKKTAIRFIHKVIISERPAQIYDKIRFNNRQRNCSKLALKDGFNKEVNRKTLIYKSIELYNALRPEMKYLSIKKLKAQLEKIRNI